MPQGKSTSTWDRQRTFKSELRRKAASFHEELARAAEDAATRTVVVAERPAGPPSAPVVRSKMWRPASWWVCRKCGDPMVPNRTQLQTLNRTCKKCYAAYKRELLKRKKSGVFYENQRRCVTCGAALRHGNSNGKFCGSHNLIARWKTRFTERVESLERNRPILRALWRKRSREARLRADERSASLRYKRWLQENRFDDTSDVRAEFRQFDRTTKVAARVERAARSEEERKAAAAARVAARVERTRQTKISTLVKQQTRDMKFKFTKSVRHRPASVLSEIESPDDNAHSELAYRLWRAGASDPINVEYDADDDGFGTDLSVRARASSTRRGLVRPEWQQPLHEDGRPCRTSVFAPIGWMRRGRRLVEGTLFVCEREHYSLQPRGKTFYRPRHSEVWVSEEQFQAQAITA